MLSDAQFDRTRRLALRLAGIELRERHRELLDHRSRRLGVRDSAGLDRLLSAAEADDPAASRQLVGLVTTNFTGFFRHPRHFELAAGQALDAVGRRGRARLWCAAAATGEEPYSLAMVLLEAFRREAPPVRILATDIDAEALAVAERGEYGEQALQPAGPRRRAAFFAWKQARHWGIVPVVRRLIEFRPLNLAGDAWPITGPFDVIFCRNVLMYLEACHRYAALERMASLLTPEGMLILDPTEHLGRAAPLFVAQGDGVHARRQRGP